MTKKIESGVDFLLNGAHSRQIDPESLREKISANLEEAAKRGAALALEADRQRREQLQGFQGQVAVHAGCAELLRCKTSMARGICWQCHSAPAQHTPLRLCGSCNSK